MNNNDTRLFIGLAELKEEGDTIASVIEKFSYYCPIVHSSKIEEKLKEGLFFVIASDKQPFTIVKSGEIHFVMHQDKDYANSKFKISLLTRIKRFIKII